MFQSGLNLSMESSHLDILINYIDHFKFLTFLMFHTSVFVCVSVLLMCVVLSVCTQFCDYLKLLDSGRKGSETCSRLITEIQVFVHM